MSSSERICSFLLSLCPRKVEKSELERSLSSYYLQLREQKAVTLSIKCFKYCLMLIQLSLQQKQMAFFLTFSSNEAKELFSNASKEGSVTFLGLAQHKRDINTRSSSHVLKFHPAAVLFKCFETNRPMAPFLN